MSVWTIVVAAGSGSRYGSDIPKQYLPLRGRTVLAWSLAAARAASDGVVLVVAADHVDDADLVAEPAIDAIVAGGATRSESVRAGLAAIDDDAVDVIVVHDAARPSASAALFAAVIDAIRNGADASLPGVPVADTIKRVDGAKVVATIDRDDLVAVQTPQAFSAASLRAAHAGGGEATDDAGLVEADGGIVVVVPGETTNRKITVPADLALAEAHLASA